MNKAELKKLGKPDAGMTMAMAIKITIAASLALFASAATLGADSRIITFDEAIRIALERNSSLRQAENAAALGEIDVNDARNDFLPDLRFNTSAAQSYGRNFSETEGGILNRTTNSVNLGVSSGLTLFDGFRNTASLKSAKLYSQASKFDLGRTRETTVFTVASNFLSLIQQREQLRVQRDNVSAESALEQQIQTYVNAGARTMADLYQQQAALANARLTLVEAERAAELSKIDLIQTLQLDPKGTYEFEPPPEASLASEGEPIGVEQMLDKALTQRSDIAAEQARLEAAGQDVRVARSGRWPSVSLNAGYNSGYTDASDLSFNDQLDLRRGGSIGLGVSIPIFDRHIVRNATRRAELQRENARIALEDAKQEVGLQVRRAQLDYQAAREQLSAAEAQLRAAVLALKASQDRYQAGAATFVELSQSRAQRTQAESNRVSAKYNLLFQRTLMDYYSGDLNVDQALN